MDAFDMKLENRNVISKQHQLCKMANLLRFVEICILLVLISRFTTTHLPVAVRNSSEYFRGLSVVFVSPRFVFVLGNAIIVTLFIKAGQFTTPKNDLYEELVEKSKKTHTTRRYESKRKRISQAEENKIFSSDVNISTERKNFRRTKSENLKLTKSTKQYCNQLWRSESEKIVKCADFTESAHNPCLEDGMSNEQFRDTVEAFIAKQKKLLREEEYYVILKDLE